MSGIWLCSVHQSSAWFQIPAMWFRLFLWGALQWKKRVFWSPSFKYKVRDLCCHILSSFPMRTFISFWICTSQIDPLICNANFSTRANSFLFFFQLFSNIPKAFLAPTGKLLTTIFYIPEHTSIVTFLIACLPYAFHRFPTPFVSQPDFLKSKRIFLLLKL